MSTHDVSTTIPRLISRNGFVRNTLPVMGLYGKKVWHATNHCLIHRRKTVITKALDLRSITAGAAGTNEVWHGRFHSGHGARVLVARIGMAPVDNSGAVDPEIFMTVNAGQTEKVHQNYENETDVADSFGIGQIVESISSDVVITWSLTLVDFARAHSICIYELGDFQADTDDGGIDPRLGQSSPLLDSNHKSLHEAQTELWKSNAAHLFSWSRDNAATAPTFTTANTYKNFWDATSAGAAATTTPHLTLEVTNHDSVVSTNVPIVMQVRGERTVGGGTCLVQINDDSDTQLIEVGPITADGWYSATANLTAGTIISSIQVKVPNGSTLRIDALSIYEHV